jgi:hypothetical protein
MLSLSQHLIISETSRIELGWTKSKRKQRQHASERVDENRYTHHNGRRAMSSLAKTHETALERLKLEIDYDNVMITDARTPQPCWTFCAGQ